MANGTKDIVQLFLDKLNKLKIDYCVIGGLAVNAYAEPVASLDLDLVLAINDIGKLLEHVKKDFSITKFEHSINLQHPDSDLRIQLQTDLRYQTFITNASKSKVLGYKMKVAALEDVLKGKVWAYSDEERRKSKRQKDLADIMRLIETHPHLHNLIPENIKKLI
ncbi:MAG: hypothetical protein A2V93_03065 [Ignavibacteria bacterium RBG_16_34_14]|nr:MAG: hypothetical protein A2V93_03065 [Ignavibacteria bacterium RBG_16_34_14]